MAVPQTASDATANSSDITNVVATLASRQNGRAKSRPITGPQRAAILMLALGEQHGGKVWSLLDDDEVRELSVVMSSLGTVEADVVVDLMLEFVSRMSASGALMGNFDATERLLQQYLPNDRVNGIMDEIRGPAGRNMWEKLSNVSEIKSVMALAWMSSVRPPASIWAISKRSSMSRASAPMSRCAVLR